MDFFSAFSAALRSHGVERVFGVPGTQTVPFLESLRRQEIAFTLTAHEGGAAFMAMGYARGGGGVGVVSTIGGPGFTNALTGIAEAAHDSVPLIHIVNAPPESGRGGLKLQAIDQVGIAKRLVKASLTLAPGMDVEGMVGRAMDTARSGEPGPVLLQLDPSEGAEDPESLGDVGEAMAAVEPRWAELVELWGRSTRPVLYLGQGAFGAAQRVEEMATRLRIPVLTTPSGRGILPESHPFAMGFDPLRGHLETANALLSRADLVVGVGCKLTHNGSAGFGLAFPEGRFVHVDAAAENIGGHYRLRLGLVGRASDAVEALHGVERDATAWSEEEVGGYRSVLQEPAEDPREPRIAGRPAADFFKWLREAVPDHALLVTDSGQHQIMTRRHYTVLVPGGLLFPSDFQSMGFGVPAATGAKLASVHRPVVALVGDGGLCMSGMEILAAVRERLPIVFIVFSDGKLNQIRLHQLSDYGRAYGSEIGTIGLESFSHAMGAKYLLYEPGALPDLDARALSVHGPTILEVPVGDSSAVPRIATRQRVKESLREAVGPDRLAWLKSFLRGRS